MFVFVILFLVSFAQGVEINEDFTPPPYVQSREAFERAHLYLQQNVPFDTRNFTNKEARDHLAFAVLADVTRMMVKDYMRKDDYSPIKVVYDVFPIAWKNYNIISNTLKLLLGEAIFKLDPVIRMMNILCKDINSAEACNQILHRTFEKSIDFTKLRAAILLALGKVSNIFNKYQDELSYMSRTFTVLPYLLQHVETRAFQSYIDDLAKTLYLVRSEAPIPEIK